MEIDMAEEGMLGDAQAYPSCRRIAFADLEIDIGHGGIEGAGIGVAHRRRGWIGRRYRHRDRSLEVLAIAGEDDHGDHALVEARRLVAQD